MITFHNDDTGVWVSKKDNEEFNKYVMTTTSIVDTLIMDSFKDNSNIGSFDKKSTMLTDFFNDVKRSNLKLNWNSFSKLNYGYGECEGKIVPIVMWFDDNEQLNFAQYISGDPEFGITMHKTISDALDCGTLSKITVTEGDVFIKEYDVANKYFYNKQQGETSSNNGNTLVNKKKLYDLKNVFDELYETVTRCKNLLDSIK